MFNSTTLTYNDINKLLTTGDIRYSTVELLMALEVMDNCGDSIAHFGINGMFLFSE